ncbi:MAG: glycosyltransferase family 2 protein [Cyanobacteriota bacterium]
MLFPKVSVIIPTFNRLALLSRALGSVLNQEYQNIEIIVINNGGESPKRIINSLNRENILLLEIEKSSRGYARNKGIIESTGKYLCFLDDDDFFYTNHISTHINFLENNKEFKISYSSSFMNVFDNLDIIEKIELKTDKFDYDSLLIKGYIPILSVVFEKKCLENILEQKHIENKQETKAPLFKTIDYYKNEKPFLFDYNILFDEFLESNEDWDFWLKLAKKFEFYPIDKITSEFFFDKNKNLESYYNTRKIIYKKYISEKRFFEVEKERANILFLDNENIKLEGIKYFNNKSYEKAIEKFVFFIENNPNKIDEIKEYLENCINFLK